MLSVTVDTLWDGRPAPPDRVVRVTLEADRDPRYLRIAVDAPFVDDLPPPGPPGPTWELWEHEVVEVFLLGQDDEYLELEMSPYGHWLALRLEGTRNIVDREVPVHFRTVVVGGLSWIGRLRLRRDLLPPGPHRLNVTAISGRKRRRRFLSWQALAGEQPDFHQLDRFVPVELP